jgi:hypothetical protein
VVTRGCRQADIVAASRTQLEAGDRGEQLDWTGGSTGFSHSRVPPRPKRGELMDEMLDKRLSEQATQEQEQAQAAGGATS